MVPDSDWPGDAAVRPGDHGSAAGGLGSRAGWRSGRQPGGQAR